LTIEEKTQIAKWAARKWAPIGCRDDAEQEAVVRILRFPPEESRPMAEQEAYARRVARSAVFRFNDRRWRRERRETTNNMRDEDETGILETVERTTAEHFLLAREADRALRRAYREAIAAMTPGERGYIEHAYGVGTGSEPVSKSLGVTARRKFVLALERNGVELDPKRLHSGGVNPEVWGRYLQA